jgi:hypothetical protein
MREAETTLTDDMESLRSEAADALCEGLPLGYQPDKQAIRDAVLDHLRAAVDQDRAEAAAQWDAEFAERTAALETLIAEEDADDCTGEGDSQTVEFKSLGSQTQMGAGIAPSPHARSPLASHDFAFDHSGPVPDCFRGTKPLARCRSGRSELLAGPSPGRSPCRLHRPSGFNPWAGHVAVRSSVLEPEPSAIRGPVRYAALRLRSDLIPCGKIRRARLAGRHHRSTGLAAWDGR